MVSYATGRAQGAARTGIPPCLSRQFVSLRCAGCGGWCLADRAIRTPFYCGVLWLLDSRKYLAKSLPVRAGSGPFTDRRV